MSFFVSPALAQGQQWSTSLDATWRDYTLHRTWSNPSDTTAVALLWGSVDEGQTWFDLYEIDNTGGPGVSVITTQPVNALKVPVTTAASGNTLAARLTGV